MEKIHITLGHVMCLDTYQRDVARDFFNTKLVAIMRNALEPEGRLMVTISGIGCFMDNRNPDDKKTKTVIGKIRNSGKLEFVDRAIAKLFNDEGLMSQARSTPHVTLISQYYRIIGNDGGPPFFDSSKFFDALKNFEFVKDLEINEICLCIDDANPNEDIPFEVLEKITF